MFIRWSRVCALRCSPITIHLPHQRTAASAAGCPNDFSRPRHPRNPRSHASRSNGRAAWVADRILSQDRVESSHRNCCGEAPGFIAGNFIASAAATRARADRPGIRHRMESKDRRDFPRIVFDRAAAEDGGVVRASLSALPRGCHCASKAVRAPAADSGWLIFILPILARRRRVSDRIVWLRPRQKKPASKNTDD